MEYKLFLASILLLILLAYPFYKSLFPVIEGSSYKCADEGGYCRCKYGTVIYGKQNTWSRYKKVKDGIWCHDNVFGDPYNAQPQPIKFDSDGKRIVPPPRPRKECICTPGCLYEEKSGVSNRGGIGGSGRSSSNSLGGVGKGSPYGGSPSHENCINTTIYENTNRTKEATEKLSELKNIVKKIRKDIHTNFNTHKKNMKAAIKLRQVGDGEEEQDDDACEHHQEACGTGDQQDAAVRNATHGVDMRRMNWS